LLLLLVFFRIVLILLTLKRKISIFPDLGILQYPYNASPPIKIPERHTVTITRQKKTLGSKKEKTWIDGSGPGMMDSYGARERPTFVKRRIQTKDIKNHRIEWREHLVLLSQQNRILLAS